VARPIPRNSIENHIIFKSNGSPSKRRTIKLIEKPPQCKEIVRKEEEVKQENEASSRYYIPSNAPKQAKGEVKAR